MTRDRLMSRLPQFAFPVVGIVYVALWCVAETGRGRTLPPMAPPPDWAIFAGFGGAIALAGRFPRSASLVAIGMTAVAAFVPAFRLFGSEWAVFIAVPIVGAAVASAPHRRAWSAVFTVVSIVLVDCWIVLAGMNEGFFMLPTGFWPSLAYTLLNPFAIAAALVMAAAWALGWALGLVRTRYAERLAAARQGAELREAELELATALEHERFAREIHDVVAHSLAGIVAQADGARYASDDRRVAGAALDAIAERGRGALVEVRRLLDSLGDPAGSDMPGLDRLGELVDGARSSGLDVAVGEHGERVALAPAQSRAMYRIVQESLTNAVRHGARGEPTRLALVWQSNGVGFEIVSPRRGDQVESPQGRGIVGMRERARSAGGWLGVDADDRRGFVVAGFLPAQPAAVSPTAELEPASTPVEASEGAEE
ncbi:sensor histidine kinase [Agromyces italicus]|uniref:sensor histidine kinase n=1 Tax=Agromyces italicus TaxID=279572 RepID=UPI0012F902CB|nr:histidine kinase [Agromyces italicus]